MKRISVAWGRRLAAAAVLGLVAVAVQGQDQDEAAIAGLKNQIIDLQNRGTLGFKDVSFCSKVIGFGSYVPLDQPVIRRGTNRIRGQYEIWYTQDIVLASADGQVIYEQQDLLTFRYYSRSPVFDLFATNSLSLGNLPPGEYLYTAVLNDRLKDARAELSLPFAVAP